jgi:hypothetical protein
VSETLNCRSRGVVSFGLPMALHLQSACVLGRRGHQPPPTELVLPLGKT